MEIEGKVRIGPDDFPFIERGSGDVLLFLHGAPGDRRIWRRPMAALADRQRCIAFTQRWFGTHEWRADGPAFGPRAHADDLVAFVEALGAGTVALVAWSYAAHAALVAAAERPDLFSRLLVFEPGRTDWVADETDLERFAADAEAAFAPVFAAAHAGDLPTAVRLLVDASGGDGWFDRQDEAARRIQLDSVSIVPRLLSQPPAPPVGCDALAALQVPVTIAWGDRSRPIFTIPSRAAAACIGGDRHVEVQGVDHLWPIAAPEAFARFVGDWLERD